MTVPAIATSRPQTAPRPHPLITAVVLTHDAAETVEAVVRAAQVVAARVVVVDSGSTDGTVANAERLGAEVLHHPFENYSAQRNWAQRELALPPGHWVLHLDADEVMDDELLRSIQATFDQALPPVDGFLIQRLSYFLGHPIRYGHLNPSFHLRLYRADRGQCEDRLYDQHYVVEGSTQRLAGKLHDLQLVSLERWTAAHNRWSTAEVAEIQRMQSESEPTATPGKVLEGSLVGDARMKKRWMKNRVWYRLPPFFRAWAFFHYSYFLRLGFLDGKPGLVYHVLQSFWFRFLVDSKLYEAERREPSR